MLPTDPPTAPFRIFLSSPGDVTEERRRARDVLTRLQRQPLLKGLASIEVVSWDDPDASAPMLATQTPQEAVNRRVPKPSTCDLTVVILWSRMGTPLAEPPRADGSLYLSGTEWEYEDAVAGGKDVLLYRRVADPQVSLRDPNLQEKLKQQALVDQFFERFRRPDGTLAGGVTPYETPAEFEQRLKQDVEVLLRERLDAAGVPEPPDVDATAPHIPATYLAWLQKECASIELLGLRLEQGQSVRLSNVYVPLTTPAASDRPGGEQPGREPRKSTLIERTASPSAGPTA